MSATVSRLRVFAASPGDTQEERDRLGAVVGELNRGIAAERGLVLELIRWETHVRPGIATDAQAVVNAQLPEPDIVVAMFWNRLGTPTPRAPSGTAEEIEAAIGRWQQDGKVELLVYFNQRAFRPAADDLGQLERLYAFRTRLEGLGVLVWEYDGAEEFEARVREHLTGAIRARPAVVAPAPASRRRRPAGVSTPFVAELDVRAAPEVPDVVAEMRAELREHGFGRRAADRAATVLLELLANVRDHGGSPAATVEANVRVGAIPSVTLTAWHSGPGFSLRQALVDGWNAYENGAREHGLVQVWRLASGLDVVQGDDGRVAVRCTVRDVPSIASGVFGEFPSVSAASIEFDVPRRCLLGGEPHDAVHLERALEHALEAPAPRLLDLCFGAMTVPDDGCLGIELAGAVAPSEVYRELIVQRECPAFAGTRSGRALHAAFEVRFRQAFESGRVVFHAFETGLGPRAMAEEWAALWGAPCFADPAELRAFLAAHTL